MSSDDKSVPVPAELYAKLSELIGKTSAESVDELVVRIIRDWVSKEISTGPKTKPVPIAAEDEKVVEERLKSLGYM